jgi:hypothetical protein
MLRVCGGQADLARTPMSLPLRGTVSAAIARESVQRALGWAPGLGVADEEHVSVRSHDRQALGL